MDVTAPPTTPLHSSFTEFERSLIIRLQGGGLNLNSLPDVARLLSPTLSEFGTAMHPINCMVGCVFLATLSMEERWRVLHSYADRLAMTIFNRQFKIVASNSSLERLTRKSVTIRTKLLDSSCWQTLTCELFLRDYSFAVSHCLVDASCTFLFRESGPFAAPQARLTDEYRMSVRRRQTRRDLCSTTRTALSGRVTFIV